MPDGDAPRDAESTSLTLLAKLRERQPDAWARFDVLYGPLIQFWCRRGGVAPGDINDVRQDVYRVVVERIDTLRRDRPGDTFRGWLRGVTRHIILAHFRRVKHFPRAEGGTDAGRRLREAAVAPADGADDPEPEVAALYRRALDLVRASFPAHYWQAFELTALENLSTDEAAARLGIKPALVRQARARVLRRLKEELGDG